MISRRQLLQGLAALPCLGKILPAAPAALPARTLEAIAPSQAAVLHDRYFQAAPVFTYLKGNQRGCRGWIGADGRWYYEIEQADGQWVDAEEIAE